MTVAGATGDDWNSDHGNHSQLLAPNTFGYNGFPLLQGAWDICGNSTRY